MRHTLLHQLVYRPHTPLLGAAKMEDVTADMMDGNKQCDTIVSECLGVVSGRRM